MRATITLRAVDLFIKWGFGDADEALREQLVDLVAEISLEQILTVARELRNSK